MTSFCPQCPHRNTCELVDNINFCEDCQDNDVCTIQSSCDAGHDVECNNGFEPKSY